MRKRMFKSQFAPLVRNGSKRQTIRPLSKRPPRAGDSESWREWSGKPYRSKTIELAQVKLLAVHPITIDELLCGIVCIMNGCVLYAFEFDKIAREDGFKDRIELVEWFKAQHGLPFTGVRIMAEDSTGVRVGSRDPYGRPLRESPSAPSVSSCSNSK